MFENHQLNTFIFVGSFQHWQVSLFVPRKGLCERPVDRLRQQGALNRQIWSAYYIIPGLEPREGGPGFLCQPLEKNGAKILESRGGRTSESGLESESWLEATGLLFVGLLVTLEGFDSKVIQPEG